MVDYCDRLEVAASKVLLGNEFAADEPGIRRDGVECGSLLVDLPGTSSGFTGLHVSVTEVRLKGGESRLEWLRHHRPKNDLEGDLERQREFDAEVWLVRGRLGDSFESATFVFTGPYMARISIGVDPEDGGLETAERLISDIRSELVRESIKILSA